jgi:hypothetical protein
VRGRPISPHSVLRAVFTQLLRHTGGRPKDDVAILIIRNDRLIRAAAAYRGAGTCTIGPPGPAADTPPAVPGP